MTKQVIAKVAILGLALWLERRGRVDAVEGYFHVDGAGDSPEFRGDASGTFITGDRGDGSGGGGVISGLGGVFRGLGNIVGGLL